MSTQAFTADPFALNALDEETELRALARTLELSEGFSLIFARCNQPDQRRRLIESLRKSLPQPTFQEMHFGQRITNLLHELRGSIADPPPNAVFVSGIEYSLPSAADAHLTPLVANLNAARDLFSQTIRCPLVLWVADYVLTAIGRGAPDFFSIRSGVYCFGATPVETINTAARLTAGDGQAAGNLSLKEKRERISAIESLLEDYGTLPANKRDYDTESRLHTRLGSLFLSLGDTATALKHFKTVTILAKQLSQPAVEATAVKGIGLAYFDQGRTTEAEAVFKQALELFRESGNRDGEADTLNDLGTVYSEQGKYSEAEQLFQESLAISREAGERSRGAVQIGNLGRIYAHQRRWQEAESALQEAVAVLRQVGDRRNEANALVALGSVYDSQGRFLEAEAAFERASQLAHELGDRVTEGIALANLAAQQAERGNLEAASELAHRALSILETAGDQQAKAWAVEVLADIEKALEVQKELNRPRK